MRKMENVKVFEFEQLGKKFRIELQYKHYMMKQNAWKKESTPAPPGQRNCVTG